MRTVLMICPFAKPNIGGVESHLEKLISYLRERKQKVTLVTYQPLTTKAKGAKHEKNESIEIHRVSWFGNGWFPRLEPYFPLVFAYLFPGLFLKSFLVCARKHREIDVIHAHGLVAATIAKILALFFDKRCVVSTHAIYKLEERSALKLLVKWLLKDFNTILAVGEPSRKELINVGLRKERIKVHPNWTNIKTFVPLNRMECRKALNLKSNDFVVLFLGRFIEIKGVLLLLDAATRTQKDIKFVFVGDGPLSDKIQEAAKISNKIKYYGKLSDAEIVQAYNAADIFISPILYEEGFGAAYLESLACGTPVITGKRGCLPYFLTSSVADLLDEVNSGSLLQIIEYYFANRDLLEDKRNICRKYAEENFSEKNAEVILNSY